MGDIRCRHMTKLSTFTLGTGRKGVQLLAFPAARCRFSSVGLEGENVIRLTDSVVNTMPQDRVKM